MRGDLPVPDIVDAELAVFAHRDGQLATGLVGVGLRPHLHHVGAGDEVDLGVALALDLLGQLG